ncbi:MAG: hypothetical protein IJ772_02935 [Bacilli bacterium]|nr:hypothetical protein [Bacilli bacterium]MBR1817783.1 hypothetical protein [Bacilli bacterium]
MKISYRLGTKSWTKEVEENLFDVLQKQLEISIPMITGAKIVKEDGSEKQILVGKKINLSFNTNYQTYYTDKYDLSLEELIDLYLEGFSSVCLLNYKKYDPIVVGLREEDEVVSDYYALKEKIKEFCK